MKLKEVSFVPGLYKIFDEILGVYWNLFSSEKSARSCSLVAIIVAIITVKACFFVVNAADNKQRDPKMNCIKIDIDR